MSDTPPEDPNSEPTTLAGDNAVALWKCGRKAWNAWIDENPGAVIDFDSVDFSMQRSGADVLSFKEYRFGDGNVSFNFAVFGDGGVNFVDAVFGDGDVSFFRAIFGDGDIFFDKTTFGSGTVCLVNARFSGALFFQPKSIAAKFLELDHIDATNCNPTLRTGVTRDMAG